LYSSGIELNKKDYTNPAIEAEFGVVLNRDIKTELSSFDYILDSIEGIYPLIEIHNLVFHGDEPHGAELLANNAIHAGVVLGPETKLPINKIETDLKLIYDSQIMDTWVDKRWPVDMLSEVNWLIKEQAKRNNYLKKGDLILTGAYGFPVPINDKKIIEVTSSAFGDVKAIFV
jgi:2-keto-4-pentenoate hydratase